MSVLLLAALDIALVLVTLGLVIGVLWARDQKQMIMLFLAFGSLVALIWVRLRAPDVALAEAALGAAVTGGLLLRMRPSLQSPPVPTATPSFIKAGAALGSIGAFVALAGALLSLDSTARASLAPAVFARLAESGVSNPVTAVLLNFRAYDTLLEVAVLFIAVIAVWMLAPRAPAMARVGDDPLFTAMLRPLVPMLCVVAGYLLWLGSFAPGGAFQAGAVLSAALVFLLLYGAPRAPGQEDNEWLRAATVAGLGIFIAVGAFTALSGAAFLQYPVAQAKNYILLIEGVLTISIALTLLILFIGGRSLDPPGRRK